MLNQQTREHLRALKLTGMLDALEQQLAQPQTHDLSFDERLALLVEQEVLHRENRRLTRLLKAAKLRVPACIEDIDYRHPRGLQKAQVAALASLDWIHQSLNLCLTGPTGCGKTWLACALGNQACRRGLSVRYLRLPNLFEQLRIAHGDGSYVRLMGQLLKTDLLILDDWGIQKLTTVQRNDLMEVIEDRHGRRSTLIASQLPVEHWHEYLGEATLADAILDRLLHGSHRLNLTGESMRKVQTVVD
ncbi:MAG: IS21-like element helper ATPase IstB [Candidatus Thiodiazotropha endolucinida]|nr:IS21-like element helper ATPase IstB [Candidatus Thiodiazotropha taylori]MCW4259778.1 IS21-like element helper ATPase IstB [Candidatus Thiodiazotropha endolucinida]MCG7891496.1 IS21-like element helper ATPase IstB [Candidatus Thiodiazotropha taylori]MCG7952936.1 IS21-like element helper ATPase IstB [Candidatus Thiodiazotropha taylori]MCW4268361.1 IS21-like element helper ATPase IstB [Candidatus Thiodiazotropha endolucinida]